MKSLEKLAYIDVETTGTRPTRDRITEIGIVLVDHGEIVHQWDSLIDPETPIPVNIQHLTGITNDMVINAPTFSSVAQNVMDLLDDRIFVAHNAAFDYGFIKNEFARLDRRFNRHTLCTVKLSRGLFPQQRRHNLDTLIQIHNVSCERRHRALDDAIALPLVVSSMVSILGEDIVEQAMQKQLRQSSIPPGLNPDALDDLPSGPGVYLFYGEDDALLYVGKSININERVRSHFASVSSNDREMRIAQQLKSIETIETAGELGALLLEAKLIKERQPLFNRQLRRNKQLYSIYWDIDHPTTPQLISDKTIETSSMPNLYGLFRSKRQMTETLRKLATSHQLCHKLTGLEKGSGSCFAHQLGKCKGACVGKEPVELHNARLAMALAPIRLKSWPYNGVIGVHEKHPDHQYEEIHLINQWRYLGKATDRDELYELLNQSHQENLDIDMYRILLKFVSKEKNLLLQKDLLSYF